MEWITTRKKIFPGGPKPFSQAGERTAATISTVKMDHFRSGPVARLRKSSQENKKKHGAPPARAPLRPLPSAPSSSSSRRRRGQRDEAAGGGGEERSRRRTSSLVVASSRGMRQRADVVVEGAGGADVGDEGADGARIWSGGTLLEKRFFQAAQKHFRRRRRGPPLPSRL